MKYAWIAAILIGLVPAIASADHRWGGHHSRSSFSIGLSFGYGGFYGGYRDYGYRSYCPPVYYRTPVVYDPAPVVVYSAPPVVYTTPSYYYYTPAPTCPTPSYYGETR